MPSTNSVVQIAAGESLSGPVVIGDATGIFLVLPPVWSGGNLTFQFSVDGTNFADVFDHKGVELTMTVVPRSVVPLDPAAVPKGGQMKIRSGSRAYPVPQAQGRDFTVTVIT